MAIIVAVFLVVALVILAFVIDQGRVFVARTELQKVADAAALAAAQDLCGEGDPVATALAYGERNGLDAIDDQDQATGNLIAEPPERVEPYDYFRVIARSDVNFFFAPFAVTNGGSGAVAAQATVRRICEIDFRFVSDRLTNFNGGTSSADNIYAGECFEGSGGSYGIVAVWVAQSYTGCWPNPPRTPIDFGTTGQGNPGSGTAVYNQPPGGVPTITATTAATAIWPIIPTLNGYVATEVCGGGTDFTTPNYPDGDTVLCAPSGGNVVLDGPLTVPHVVADDDIADGSSTPWVPNVWDDENGEFLVYSRTGDITISGNYLPKNVTLYAPNGTVSFSGGGATIDGRVFGQNIVLNGGGSDAATGVGVPIPGDAELVN